MDKSLNEGKSKATGKRKLEETKSHSSEITTDDPYTKKIESKKFIEEGYSWWTCLMYDMPLSKSQPQIYDMLSSSDEVTKTEQIISDLPPKPPEPLQSDCCGSGCTPCVFDIYEQELKIWERECEIIKSGYQTGDEDQEQVPELSILQYNKYKIVSVCKESVDVFRFRFYLHPTQKLGLKLGQHIIIRDHFENQSIVREYTPVTDIDVEGYFELLIKVYPGGLMSHCIRLWAPEDWIEMRGPFGSLPYKPNQYSRLILMASGTGIAPMAQVIQYVLNNENDETFLHLVYGCRSYADIFMKHEIDDWTHYWNFSVLYCLSQETSDSLSKEKKYGEIIHCGRIDTGVLQGELQDKNVTNIMCLICGSKTFQNDVHQFLLNLDIPEDQLFRF